VNKKDIKELNKHFNLEVTKEYKDGSAQLTIEHDDYFKDFIKKIYGRYSKKNVKKFVISGIEQAIKKEDN